ncbi:MAG: VOC family protein [Candidatus Latescibacterota bacterium]
MQLDGIHHVTCITAEAARNVDFYTRVLGLRLVKKTVNQDDPTVYHLFYADEDGSPGSDITFFEHPGVRRGQAGAGMVHTVIWRVASEEALDFWGERLAGEALPMTRTDGRLRFQDPEGLGLELAVVQTPDAPLVAGHPEIAAELALQGFDGVRALADPRFSRTLLERTLGFAPAGEAAWQVRGESRGSLYACDPPRGLRPASGAGTVHHVAWSSRLEDHEEWLGALSAAQVPTSGIVDRFWFRSIYFREPGGVLFEIATAGPGLAVDEDPERLGEHLTLPPAFEPMRQRLEGVLTPLPDPRPWARR